MIQNAPNIQKTIITTKGMKRQSLTYKINTQCFPCNEDVCKYSLTDEFFMFVRLYSKHAIKHITYYAKI